MVRKLTALFCLTLSGLAFAGLVSGGNCLTPSERTMLEFEYNQKSNLELQLQQQLHTAEAQLSALSDQMAEECPGPNCEFITFLYNQKQIEIWGIQSSIMGNNDRLFQILSLLGLQDCPTPT